MADTGADLVPPASTVLSGLQSRDSPSSEEGMVASRLLGRTPFVSSPAHWSDPAASSQSRLVRSGWRCQSVSVVREIFSILLSPQPISPHCTTGIQSSQGQVNNRSLCHYQPAAFNSYQILNYAQLEYNSAAPLQITDHAPLESAARVVNNSPLPGVFCLLPRATLPPSLFCQSK